MTLASPTTPLTSSGVELQDLAPLRDSSPLLTDPPALRQRMADDGYLFLPGLLPRQDVLDARREVTSRLAAQGLLNPNYPPIDAIPNGPTPNFLPEILAKDNAPLTKILYSGPMIHFFQSFLGQPVLHYDFTWFRSIPPGHGSASHCDVIYMGRGEREQLYTAWTPIGDVDLTLGGLIVLEGSHRHEKLKSTYGQMDIDSYCQNKPDAQAWGKSWGTGGQLKGNPNQIRHSLGGRWLTTSYHAGDVLIFSVFTVHASLDNHSTAIRLSSDSRYQPASSPADNRWIGPNPIAHSNAGKRGKTC